MQNIERFNPRAVAQKQAVENQLVEMSIACEIFVSNYATVHYTDIMPNIKPGQISPRSIQKMLEDRKYKNNKIKGILRMYGEHHPEDFDMEGRWIAANLPNYIAYVANKLTDKSITKTNANDYAKCMHDKEWFEKFIALSSVILLERQSKKIGGLYSSSAQIILKMVFNNREMYNKIAAITGRQGKNHGMLRAETDLTDMIKTFNDRILVLARKQTEAQTEEMQAYNKWKPLFLNEIENTRLLISNK